MLRGCSSRLRRIIICLRKLEARIERERLCRSSSNIKKPTINRIADLLNSNQSRAPLETSVGAIESDQTPTRRAIQLEEAKDLSKCNLTGTSTLT